MRKTFLVGQAKVTTNVTNIHECEALANLLDANSLARRMIKFEYPKWSYAKGILSVDKKLDQKCAPYQAIPRRMLSLQKEAYYAVTFLLSDDNLYHVRDIRVSLKKDPVNLFGTNVLTITVGSIANAREEVLLVSKATKVLYGTEVLMDDPLMFKWPQVYLSYGPGGLTLSTMLLGNQYETYIGKTLGEILAQGPPQSKELDQLIRMAEYKGE